MAPAGRWATWTPASPSGLQRPWQDARRGAQRTLRRSHAHVWS